MFLLLAACRRQPSSTVFVDPALATLVPADTVFIAGARVQQLQSTPFYQRYVLQGKLLPAEKFARETGIDIHKDVWEVLIPFDGKTFTVMLRGKFAEMGLEPRLGREGAQRMGYKGYTILGDEERAVIFLNPTTAIAGSTPALKRVVDGRNTTSGIPARLSNRIQSIAATNQAWFVGSLPVQTPKVGSLEMPAQLLRSVDLITGVFDLRSGVQAHISAISRSDADAKRVSEALQALIGFTRLSTPGDRSELFRLYDRIEVQNAGSTVHVRANVPPDLLEQVIQRAQPVNGATR